MSTLVNSFLLFARPPGGEAEAIELEQALGDILELFEKDGSYGHRIQLVQHLASKVWIRMDPVHLRQVVWNLLLNAAEAIADRGTITITTRRLKNKKVEIRISDTGCGMDSSVRKSMFDPFFTTKPRGTGLGLSIVHNILESNDCGLEIDTTVNKGTSVTFRLTTISAPTPS